MNREHEEQGNHEKMKAKATNWMLACASVVKESHTRCWNLYCMPWLLLSLLAKPCCGGMVPNMSFFHHLSVSQSVGNPQCTYSERSHLPSQLMPKGWSWN